MPRYQVIQNRMYKSGYLIEADSEEDAKRLRGTIIDEAETDWGYETLSVERVEDEADLDLDL